MLLSIVLVSAFSINGASTAGFTALDLMEECEAVVETSPTPKQAMGASHCMGYLSGIGDAHSIVASMTPSARLWCEPTVGLTSLDRLTVVAKFLVANPESIKESARSAVVIAHAKAYPCTPAKP